MTSSTPRRVERLPTVMSRTGMRRSWIYKEISAGRFPAPIKIGRVSGWDSSELDAWIDALVDHGLSSAPRIAKVH